MGSSNGSDQENEDEVNNGVVNQEEGGVSVERITFGSQYGGRTYDIDPANAAGDRERRIVETFRNAIDSQQRSLTITNSLFEVNDGNDPDPGRRKKATIQYRMYPSGPLLCQTCYESEGMNFLQHCLEISYGPHDRRVTIMNNADVYEKFNRALKNSLEQCNKEIVNFLTNRKHSPDAVEVNIENLGGEDPAVGQAKSVKVVYQRNGPQQKAVTASEGEKWPELMDLNDSLGEWKNIEGEH